MVYEQGYTNWRILIFVQIVSYVLYKNGVFSLRKGIKIPVQH